MTRFIPHGPHRGDAQTARGITSRARIIQHLQQLPPGVGATLHEISQAVGICSSVAWNHLQRLIADDKAMKVARGYRATRPAHAVLEPILLPIGDIL